MRASSWRKATPPAVGGQHARAQALLEAGELVLGRERLEQPQLGVRPRDRDGAQQRRGRRAEARGAGEDGVADRGRDVALAGGQHLGEEERVAGRAPVELLGVEAVGLGQRRDRLGRQPWQLAALDPPRRGQLAEHDPQRVAQLELVVAVGRDDEGGLRVHLARDEAQDVERRRVGPVQVLEHEDRGRAAPQLVEQGGRDLVGPRGARRDLGELAPDLLGDVEQRAERARREQRVARPPQDARRAPMLVGEEAHERRLAGARLARDERQAPARAVAHGVEHRLQRVELGRALQ